jgi:hypothetical protein
MTAAMLYAIVMRRMTSGLYPDAAVVTITQLAAAQEINATWLIPIAMLGQCTIVSISSANGCQLSAATRPRLANASFHAPVRQPLMVALRSSTVLIYSPSVSCRN